MVEKRTDTLARYIRDRNEALLTLDAELISAFYHRWHLELPRAASFWLVVHRIRHFTPDMPAKARAESATWLRARGYRALDGSRP